MPLDHRERRAATPPLCWLHGFTQTGASAHQFRAILTATREVLTPDLARHGARGQVGGSLDDVADAVVRELPHDPVDLGGYSFGARVALHVAIRHPERVRRLVLLGATRGIADDSARAARRERDEALAAKIEQIGTEAFLDQWMSQPMFADLPFDPRERASREGQSPSNLAASLREAGTGTQRWLNDEIGELPMVILTLAGASDERFSREARAIAQRARRASFQLVPGAAHAAHLHQPTWSAALVATFLDD